MQAMNTIQYIQSALRGYLAYTRTAEYMHSTLVSEMLSCTPKGKLKTGIVHCVLRGFLANHEDN